MTFIIGTPHTRNAGYLCNNQDLSIAKREEADIRTCTHCQTVIKMKEWRDDGAWCSKCNAPVCAHGVCAKKTEELGCIPYIKYIETVLEGQTSLEQFRKMAGVDSQPADYKPAIYVASR
jgi:hypothetical protein